MRTVYHATLIALLCFSCVDPVVPTYDYQDGTLIINGALTDVAGTSQVSLQRNTLSYGTYGMEPVVAQSVSSVDGSGAEVSWQETAEAGVYVPPADYAPTTGERYAIRIRLSGGELIESVPETLLPAVPLPPLRMRFAQESYYSDAEERFIPAFTLVTDVADPPDADNVFLYEHRTWVQQPICQSCFGSVYRNGSCVETRESRLVYRYDYACSEPCWSITPGREIYLFSDERNSGGTTTDFPVARIDYTGSGGILAEVAQLSVSRSAYEYYSLLRDLTEGSSGLNAPLPAPLYGNLTNLSSPQEPVLGYFLVSSRSQQRLYWNRDHTPGTPLSGPLIPNFEDVQPSPPSAPCDGPNRTTTQPEGWNP